MAKRERGRLARKNLVFFFWVLLVLRAGTLATGAPREKPNVIVIVADDMGYSDAGCYGGEISTPNLDGLARQGVRLTNFYNAGMCVVSRVSLLTGQYWPRAQPRFATTPILPEKLKADGYRTALIGKWHLPGDPMNRGFDHFFGFLGGFSSHFSGSPDYRFNREPFKDFGPNYYSSDAFSERAINFIKDKSTKPFFLYLSYQAPHNPLQAPRADILKYRGKYLKGWQAIRAARFEQQKKLGVVPPQAKLPDYPQNLPSWENLTPAQRDLEDLRMAVYSAMIERMDKGIGQLLNALKEQGKMENTLILFLSDNGADAFSVLDKAMLQRDLLPGDAASNWQPGTGWAYAVVTPFRLYKISQHGGGVATGAIASWPSGITKTNHLDASPLHVIDVMPTLLDAIGAQQNVADGESFLPLLQGQKWQRKQPLYFQFMDNRAIRAAQWHMAEVDGAGWELFRADDALETTNLAAQNPEIVAQLSAQWLAWWRQSSGKPDYKPESTKGSTHYKPQGDRGSGASYIPGAMPPHLANRYPLP